MSFIHDIYECRKSFRHIEKLTLRCVHLKNAVEFNETCLNNGIFPKYCHIYIHTHTLYTHCLPCGTQERKFKNVKILYYL